MRFQSEFDKILNQKMKNHSESPSSNSVECSTSTPIDHTHLAYLMGQIARRQRPQPSACQAYKTQAQPKVQKNNSNSKQTANRPEHASQPRRAPRSAHLFTAEQAQAFQSLRLYSENFPSDFTEVELKTTFRKLALKFHPDTTIYKNSESTFMEIKKAFDTLKDLFIMKPTSEEQKAA